MDKTLTDAISNVRPKMNPVVAKGLATVQIPLAMEWLHSIIQTFSSSTMFPDGLIFHSIERCTPHEEVEVLAKKRSGKRIIDIARNSVYMVKIKFTYFGEMTVPVYLFLPFVEDAGLMYLRGSHYMVLPTLADTVISIETDNILVALLCAKLKFERLNYTFLLQGIPVAKTIVYSEIHNEIKRRSKNSPAAVNGRKSIVLHYLFAKYGVKETFKKYTKTDVVIGGFEDITTNNYPSDKWVIAEYFQRDSSRKKYNTGVSVAPIRIAVKQKQLSETTQSFIAGFFYLLESFGTNIELEWFTNPQDEEIMWKSALGLIIFSNGLNRGDLLNRIEEHFRSLDEYINELDKKLLHATGVKVENVYDLFGWILNNYVDKTNSVAKEEPSLYGKHLGVLRHLLYDITACLNNARFKLTSESAKVKNGGRLTKEDIEKILRESIKTDVIMGAPATHSELASVACPGDNRLFKITNFAVPQSKSGRSANSSHDRSISLKPSSALHISKAEVSTFVNISQADYVGNNKINPYVTLTPEAKVVRNPKYIPMLDRAQEIIDAQ